MLARTHGQKATPTTMGKEFANVVIRLRQQLESLKNIKFYGKMNGAVGNFNAHHVVFPEKNWPEISKTFVESLGLHYQAYTTQIEPHDFVAEFLHNLMRINTILIDFSRDIWGYISLEYFHQKNLAQEVGSSTMPHKVNPIDFENAEGNFYLSNGLFACLTEKLPISRFQRDLVDSTLMRNIGSGMGYAMVAYQSLIRGLNKIEINGAHMEKDLEHSWEIMAEPIQMAMRAYGVSQAYEKLKALTRGKQIDQQKMIDFIDQLSIPEDMKEKLKKLTPQSYIGYARKLAENV
jgi:adenylosuccinate lyase